MRVPLWAGLRARSARAKGNAPPQGGVHRLKGLLTPSAYACVHEHANCYSSLVRQTGASVGPAGMVDPHTAIAEAIHPLAACQAASSVTTDHAGPSANADTWARSETDPNTTERRSDCFRHHYELRQGRVHAVLSRIDRGPSAEGSDRGHRGGRCDAGRLDRMPHGSAGHSPHRQSGQPRLSALLQHGRACRQWQVPAAAQ